MSPLDGLGGGPQARIGGPSVTRRILIVDANEAFAAMLAQGLEDMLEAKTSVVTTGRGALQAVSATEFDLVIVDMALPDVEPTLLVRSLRHEHPHLRLAVIPLAGEEIPPELTDVDLQGTLPKPFFLPELPGRVRAILSRPVGGEPMPEGPAPVARERLPQALRLMSRLAQEIGAEAVLLIHEGELLAQTGRLSEEEVTALASVVSDSWRTSARVAQILGKEQLRFEQSIEGAEHLLYSLALADDLILSLIVKGKTPLGMIRHRAKETAEAIRGLMVG